MVLKIADNRSPDSMASRFRRRRMGWLFDLLGAFEGPVRVLDVGGTPTLWLHNQKDLPRPCQVTFLNLYPVDTSGLEGAVSVTGDARRMPEYADGSFDLCFSNSVIEHVGALYDQRAMASEIRRVCRAYFVQTPNRYFPMEPHFLVPFWQFMPLRLRALLHRRFNLGWTPRQPDPLLSRADVEQIRLLTRSEMHGLYPDARIVLERIGPLVKSIVAIREPARD